MRPKQLRMMGAVPLFAPSSSRPWSTKVAIRAHPGLKPRSAPFFASPRHPAGTDAGGTSAMSCSHSFAQLRHDLVRQREAALSACRVWPAIMPYCFMQSGWPAPSTCCSLKWDAAIVRCRSWRWLAFRRSPDSRHSVERSRQFRRLLIYACVLSPIFFVFVTIGAHLAAATGSYRGQPVLRRTLALLFLRRVQAHGGVVA